MAKCLQPGRTMPGKATKRDDTRRGEDFLKFIPAQSSGADENSKFILSFASHPEDTVVSLDGQSTCMRTATGLTRSCQY